jgi:phage shock protein A
VNEPSDDEIVDAVPVEDTTIALPATELTTDYTEAGLPTFDYVRDRIEGRIATSIGSAELPDEAKAAAQVDDQFAAREKAGKDRLAEIRRAMRKE